MKGESLLNEVLINSSNNSKIVKTKLTFDDGSVQEAVIDTGSSYSFVNPNFIKIGDIEEIDGTRFRIIDKSHFTLSTVTTLNFDINGMSFRHQFYIFPHMSYAMILGVDFCRESGISISFTDNDVIIWTYPEIEDTKQHFVRLDKTIRIPPNSEIILQADADDYEGDALFKPVKNLESKYGLKILPSLIKTSENYCQLIGYNNQPHPIL